MSQHTFDFGGRAPLAVSYGMGRDSTAMLVGYAQRGIRPDAILFADVGAERQHTYDYLPVIDQWLESQGFPAVTVVRYQPKNYKHWPPYHTIEENILTNVSLPAIAYGGHTCSSKWKIDPQNAWLKQWGPALEAWAGGLKVSKAIGFEDSAHEHRRRARCSTFAIQDDEADLFDFAFPLQEWGWNLERCIAEIMRAGLPVPPKSSCYFCTALKPWELDEIAATEPDKLERIVIIEARTRKRHLDYAESKGWPAGVGVPLVHGLWRKPVKGMRGATPRPGSMTEYIREKQYLPAAQIDALVALTPQTHVTQAEFEAAGVRDWQDWIQAICNEAKNRAATTAA